MQTWRCWSREGQNMFHLSFQEFGSYFYVFCVFTVFPVSSSCSFLVFSKFSFCSQGGFCLLCVLFSDYSHCFFQ